MYDTNDYLEFKEQYLAHHGVKGQKWGIRRLEDKLKKEKLKAKIAEQKRLQKDPYKQEIGFIEDQHKIEREDSKQKVKNGKSIAKVLLTTAVLGGLAFSAIVVRHKSKIADGKAIAEKNLRIQKQKGINKANISRTKTAAKIAKMPKPEVKKVVGIPAVGALRG